MPQQVQRPWPVGSTIKTASPLSGKVREWREQRQGSRAVPGDRGAPRTRRPPQPAPLTEELQEPTEVAHRPDTGLPPLCGGGSARAAQGGSRAIPRAAPTDGAGGSPSRRRAEGPVCSESGRPARPSSHQPRLETGQVAPALIRSVCGHSRVTNTKPHTGTQRRRELSGWRRRR